MQDHGHEEDRIEPRKRGREASDQAPGERKVHIAGIVDLTCVLVPTVYENGVAGWGRDLLWILDVPPRNLRESFSLLIVASFSQTEFVLLALRAVPDPVNENVGRVE